MDEETKEDVEYYRNRAVKYLEGLGKEEIARGLEIVMENWSDETREKTREALAGWREVMKAVKESNISGEAKAQSILTFLSAQVADILRRIPSGMRGEVVRTAMEEANDRKSPRDKLEERFG